VAETNKEVLIANSRRDRAPHRAGHVEARHRKLLAHSEADANSLPAKAGRSRGLYRWRSRRASYLSNEDGRAAVAFGADAIHPGYGFWPRTRLYAECAGSRTLPYRPSADVIRPMGDKIEARKIAAGSGAFPPPRFRRRRRGVSAAREMAEAVGYPMLSRQPPPAARGMRVIQSRAELGPRSERSHGRGPGRFR